MLGGCWADAGRKLGGPSGAEAGRRLGGARAEAGRSQGRGWAEPVRVEAGRTRLGGARAEPGGPVLRSISSVRQLQLCSLQLRVLLVPWTPRSLDPLGPSLPHLSPH